MKKNIAGNIEKKYDSSNPIIKYIMQNFLNNIEILVQRHCDNCNSFLEVGCGEGKLASFIFSKITKEFRACDVSLEIINEAKKNFPYINFFEKNIYDLTDTEKSDAVFCCEVLEHLECPEKALEKLEKITGKLCIISVPNEPLWRMLNFLRFKYVFRLGNTPGHINHWNRKGILDLIRNYFDIIYVSSPIPWTIILCKKRNF